MFQFGLYYLCAGQNELTLKISRSFETFKIEKENTDFQVFKRLPSFKENHLLVTYHECFLSKNNATPNYERTKFGLKNLFYNIFFINDSQWLVLHRLHKQI